SLVVVPGRWPSSISACTTQFLRVSGLIPSCSPTRRNAPDLVAGSRRASTAILVALSRSSSGYFLGAAMLLILPWIQSLHQTRGDSPPCCSRDAKHPCCMPCVLLGTRHCRRRSAQGSLHQYPELAHREGRARTRGMVRLPHRLRTSAGGRCLPVPSASPPLLWPTIPRA